MTPTRLLATLAFALALPSFSHAQAARVTIDSGTLVGETSPDGAVFKGVPYAAAPVADLRWAPPQPVQPWTGDRPASTYGPNCPQKLNPNGAPNAGGATGPISEDCLFLNVWAPAHANKAPVMVWVHGGANIAGAGSLGAYDGSAFQRDGVILVTLNYRLGAFGFFAHPALTAAAKPDEPLVNYGLMDQIAALQWVKRNIAAFGGDPDNVTLFGESAGGQDTLLLMTSPAAQGLFAKAIVESGGGWGEMASLPRREAQDSALAHNAGAPANATVAQLRALPMAKLIDWPALRGGPAVDGRLIIEPTTQAFAVGHYAHVPLIIGSNSWEASLLRAMHAPPGATFAMVSPEAASAYADIPDPAAREQALFTDVAMGGPARWIAGKTSRDPSYLYSFAYVPEVQRASVPGAGHATEIPFVFDSWEHLGAAGMGIKPSPADLAMTATIHGCWVSFAKTGTPTCPGAPAWPTYAADKDALMQFAPPAPTIQTRFNAAHYDALQAAEMKRAGIGQ